MIIDLFCVLYIVKIVWTIISVLQYLSVFCVFCEFFHAIKIPPIKNAKSIIEIIPEL